MYAMGAYRRILYSKMGADMNRPDIKSMTKEELREYVLSLSEKPFRADQLFSWMHEKGVASIPEMTNLSKTFRTRLEEVSDFVSLTQITVQESKLDGTRKYLFALSDGHCIESVLMRYQHGNSVCISSQVGCNMGCSFCASALGGKIRDLSASEMLDQIYRIGADIGERISNVVVMGTGEPLDNYDNLIRFIRLITDPAGKNISQRNITVSTCGIVPGIRRLMQEDLAITLALSLHAPTQRLREQIMPVAKKYPLSDVLEACSAYFKTTGRRVTMEYSLIHGVNDSAGAAELLASLPGMKKCHINLIPVNPVREKTMQSPAHSQVLAFKNKLEKYGINVTIRREMGRDIDGACGQLRRRFAENGSFST